MPCILLLPRWSIDDGCTCAWKNAIAPLASFVLYTPNAVQRSSNVLGFRRASPDQKAHVCKQGSEHQVRTCVIAGDTINSHSVQDARQAAHNRSGLAGPNHPPIRKAWQWIICRIALGQALPRDRVWTAAGWDEETCTACCKLPLSGDHRQTWPSRLPDANSSRPACDSLI